MFACINRIPNFSWPYRRHEEKKDHSSQPYEDPEMTFLLPPRDMITGAVAAISDPRGDLENGSHTLRKQEEQKTRAGGPWFPADARELPTSALLYAKKK